MKLNLQKIREEIIKRFKENGRVEMYSPILDSYKKGTHPVPFSWGEDYFIKIVPNPGGNKIFFHIGRRLFKRVGGRWLIDHTYYALKNKEVTSIKELEFLLNSKLLIDFAKSVRW